MTRIVVNTLAWPAGHAAPWTLRATVELLSSVRGAIALTDDAGRFVLPAAAPWPERVSVSHPDHLPPATAAWTSPGTPLRLQLRAPPP